MAMNRSKSLVSEKTLSLLVRNMTAILLNVPLGLSKVHQIYLAFVLVETHANARWVDEAMDKVVGV